MPHAEGEDTWTKLSLLSEHARRDTGFKFTSVAYLLNKEFLRACYLSLNRHKAVGIDKVSGEDYGRELEGNLESLVLRLKSKRYQPTAATLVCIPKSEMGKRPLGILVLENKIVERAIAWILEAIYERAFMNFSTVCHMIG